MSQEVHFYEVFYFSNRFSNEIYKSLTANNIRENLIIWEARLTMYNSVNWETLFTGIEDKFYLGFQNISHQQQYSSELPSLMWMLTLWTFTIWYQIYCSLTNRGKPLPLVSESVFSLTAVTKVEFCPCYIKYKEKVHIVHNVA